MSQKLYPELLYPLGEPRHRALNDVVNIVQLQSFEGACEEAQVLFDQITQLWSGPDRLLIWDPYGNISGVDVGLLLHRWMVIDAIYAARSIPSHMRIVEGFLRDAENWVKYPSDANAQRARAAAERLEEFRPDPQSPLYYSEVAVNLVCSSAGARPDQRDYAVGGALNSCLYSNASRSGGLIDQSVQHATRLRFKLLETLATHGLLPEPVV